MKKGAHALFVTDAIRRAKVVRRSSFVKRFAAPAAEQNPGEKMKTFLNRSTTAVLCSTALALAACGGGGGSGGTPPARTNATAGCFDLDKLLAPGFSSKITMQSSDSTQSGVTTTSEQETTVVGGAMFNNQAVLRLVSKSTEFLPGGPQVVTVTTDFQRTGPAQVTTFHDETVFKVGGADSINKTDYQPPLVDDFYGLALGQSLEQRTQGTVTYSSTDPSSTPRSEPVDDTNTLKLAAIETITIPAGTFETCRFEYANKADPSWKGQFWSVRGLGVYVKSMGAAQVSNNQTKTWESVATSVEVNGKKL